MSIRIKPTDTDANVWQRLAKSTAADMWGTPIQRQRAIIRGKAWRFDTPGHGGYVIALTAEELAAFPLGTWRDGSQRYPVVRGRHVVAFEEDCDWCLPVLFLPGFSEALCAVESNWSGDILADASRTFNAYADGYYVMPERWAS